MNSIFKRLQEPKSNNKLQLADLMKYPYQFHMIWRGSPNPTYGDDFLELAEAHNCIKIHCQPYRYYNRYICKSKSDYESLKTALLENSMLSGFISLSPIVETNWDDVIQKLPYIYVDRYSGGYSVKVTKSK